MLYLKYLSHTMVGVRGDEEDISRLREFLTYSHTSAKWEYERLKKQKWLIGKYGKAWYDQQLSNKKALIHKTLLFDSAGGSWTYTGIVNKILEAFGNGVVVEGRLEYPDPQLLAWHIPPKNKLRYYQLEAVDALLRAKHGAVEMSTGSGKTQVITQVVKELGLKSVIMCPSSSIAEQIYINLKINFGKKKVGMFDATHKESEKQIVVAVGQSLVRINEESVHWENLAKSQVFIADEAHVVPAETFNKVCMGVFKNVPYRFFFSATQMRNDGQGILLNGIIGPIVYEYPIEKAIEDGYLVPMHFKMVRVSSDKSSMMEDPNENTRMHLYYNDKVIDKIAAVANNAVSVLGRKVLILIEEIEQFARLYPKLEHSFCFAHGGNLDADQKSRMPQEYHSPDNTKLVEKYNSGEYPIMIGTSAVSMGTDIRAADFIIYAQGGKSEIQVKQAIGRGTRLFPGKKNCVVVDFDVYNNTTTHRHVKERIKIYQTIGNLEYVET